MSYATRTPRRDESLSRAFEFVELLIGSEWVLLGEVGSALGIHRRTSIRYAHAAERAGIIEWRRGHGCTHPREPHSAVRLLNRRLRRAA